MWGNHFCRTRLQTLCGDSSDGFVEVGVTQDVVVLGAVLGEIERGVLEYGDEVAQLFDLLRAVAELVGVVEVREIAAGEAGIGVNQRLNDRSEEHTSELQSLRHL